MGDDTTVDATKASAWTDDDRAAMAAQRETDNSVAYEAGEQRSREVVHRDVKPVNMALARKSAQRLIDVAFRNRDKETGEPIRPRFCIPAHHEDDDLVLTAALDELESLRGASEPREPAPEAVSMAIRLARFEALSEAAELADSFVTPLDDDGEGYPSHVAAAETAHALAERLRELRNVARPRAPGASVDDGLLRHELAPLAARMTKGRGKYPTGCTALALLDEAGEFAHAINKGESADRVRDELLDVAAVAMRLYFGEVDTASVLEGLAQRAADASSQDRAAPLSSISDASAATTSPRPQGSPDLGAPTPDASPACEVCGATDECLSHVLGVTRCFDVYACKARRRERAAVVVAGECMQDCDAPGIPCPQRDASPNFVPQSVKDLAARSHERVNAPRREATCSEYIGPEGERCAKPAPCQEHQAPIHAAPRPGAARLCGGCEARRDGERLVHEPHCVCYVAVPSSSPDPKCPTCAWVNNEHAPDCIDRARRSTNGGAP